MEPPFGNELFFGVILNYLHRASKYDLCFMYLVIFIYWTFLSQKKEIKTVEPQPKGYLSLYDLAYIHDTTEWEVFRVWTMVLNMEPKTQFDEDDLFRLNRILCPVLEPWEILKKQ